MSAAPLAFLATPAGQALLTGLMEEAPKLFGEVLGIWGKSGEVSAEEIATFIAGYKPSGTFYPSGSPASSQSGTFTGLIGGTGDFAGGAGK